MIFHTTFLYLPDNRNAIQKRFVETGGKPPAGVRMIERMHVVGSHKGYIVFDAPDALSVAKWFQEWTDMVTFQIEPVMSDEQVLEMIQS